MLSSDRIDSIESQLREENKQVRLYRGPEGSPWSATARIRNLQLRYKCGYNNCGICHSWGLAHSELVMRGFPLISLIWRFANAAPSVLWGLLDKRLDDPRYTARKNKGEPWLNQGISGSLGWLRTKERNSNERVAETSDKSSSSCVGRLRSCADRAWTADFQYKYSSVGSCRESLASGMLWGAMDLSGWWSR